MINLHFNSYHGTVDTTLAYANFNEQLKQWSNVLGVSFDHSVANTPISGYTKMIYGDGTKLVGISCNNVGHTPPVRIDDDLAWFGIPGSGNPPSATTTTAPSGTTTTSNPPTTTSTGTNPGAPTSPHWGQW